MTDFLVFCLCFGLVMGVAAHLEARRVRFIWQSGRLYRNAGLYLKVGDKRYWVVKVRGV